MSLVTLSKATHPSTVAGVFIFSTALHALRNYPVGVCASLSIVISPPGCWVHKAGASSECWSPSLAPGQAWAQSGSCRQDAWSNGLGGWCKATPLRCLKPHILPGRVGRQEKGQLNVLLKGFLSQHLQERTLHVGKRLNEGGGDAARSRLCAEHREHDQADGGDLHLPGDTGGAWSLFCCHS